MLDNLKPCRCGSEVALSGMSVYSEIYHDLIPAFAIKCCNCGATVGPLPIIEKESLIWQWNEKAANDA